VSAKPQPVVYGPRGGTSRTRPRKGGDLVRVMTVTLDEGLARRVAVYCAANNRGLSQVMAEAVTAHLNAGTAVPPAAPAVPSLTPWASTVDEWLAAGRRFAAGDVVDHLRPGLDARDRSSASGCVMLLLRHRVKRGRAVVAGYRLGRSGHRAAIFAAPEARR